MYDPGDTFVEFTDPDADDVINDLDLYLLPKGATDAGEAVWNSIASVGTVEHMLIDIQFTGEYEFWVLQNDIDVGPQDYGLAWWYGEAPEIEPPRSTVISMQTVTWTARTFSPGSGASRPIPSAAAIWPTGKRISAPAVLCQQALPRCRSRVLRCC